MSETRKSPADRLAEKVKAFGDMAALEPDEVAAYLDVSMTQLERIDTLPWSAVAGVRSKRCLFGSLVAWVRKGERAA